jgi:hypothetical protein
MRHVVVNRRATITQRDDPYLHFVWSCVVVLAGAGDGVNHDALDRVGGRCR